MDNQAKTRVLIVEDDSSNLVIMNEYVLSFECVVDVAIDGSVALEKLATGSFGIVLTDIIMPNINGLQLLKHINDNYSHIDVMVVSGHVAQYTPESIINAGATEFLPKPFTPEEFKSAFKRIYEKQHQLTNTE